MDNDSIDDRSPLDERAGEADPVRRRRLVIAKWTALANKAGYSLYGLSIALFVVGLVAGWTGGFTAAVTLSLVLGSILLAPAIVLGYAIKAAEREDVEVERRRDRIDPS